MGKPAIWDFFVKIEYKLYHRPNPCSSFRPSVHLVVEIQSFVCDHTTPPIIEKLRSKGIAMHVYGVCILCLRVKRKSVKWTWAELFKMNVKIEQGSDFDVDNGRRLFFDAQEAKQVSDCIVIL